MSRPYHLVVFDWEGTLGDTLCQILNTIAVEAQRLNFGKFDERSARQYVMLGLVKAVKKLFPHLSLHQHEQLLHNVQHALAANPTDACLFPGTKEIVRRIHEAGMALAIATNKGPQSLQRVLHASGLDAFFTVTRAAGQVPAKPCPQMLQEIMEVFAVTSSQTLMVGDSVADVEMAKQVSVDVVGVDFYEQEAANLRAAGALHVFNDYQQLAHFLKLPTS